MTLQARPTPVRPLLVGIEWFDDVPGGLNRYVRDLHAGLTQAGVRPHTLVTGPMAEPVPGVEAVFRHTGPLIVRMGRLALAARRLRNSCDVVDAHFPLTAAPVLAMLRRKPFVMHFHGPWSAESRSGGENRRMVLSAKTAMERAVYRRASRVVVLSRAFGRLAAERYGIDPSRVEVLHPGVDLDRFTPGDAETARVRIGIPRGAFAVLAVRRLVPRVGLTDLLDAWALSGLYRAGAVLLIAGEGPLRGALEARADDLGVGSSVRFLGRISDDDLVHYYRAVDVSIVPSVELEGFGLIVLESLACGTPVLATDVGGLPEALNGLQPDLVTPPGRPDLLAARLSAAVDGGGQPLPDRSACRRHAERYGWQRVIDRHQKVYAEAVAGCHPRPSVVFLDHCAQLSGAELSLSRLLPALTRGVDAHVILAEDGPLVDRLRAAGASVEVLPMPTRARLLRRDRVRGTAAALLAILPTAAYCVRLRRRLRIIRPDVVHTNSLKSALYGGLSARAAGIPVIWHVHDRIAADYLPSSAVRLVRRSARWFATALIANSEATRASLRGAGRGARVIPSPVEVTERPRVPHRFLRVAMVGRLAPWKGQVLFLSAFAKAFPGGSERAVIVGGALFGEESYERGLRVLADQLGITDRVEFRGFREDVAAELAEVDVVVHCSTMPEPFGQVVVEGMAAGLPVVAANAGGPAEVIRHDVDGLLYPMSDEGALAATLQTLAADPGLRERLSTAARHTARRFTADAVAHDILAVYREVLVQPRHANRKPEEGA
jgi:glycosyltransferase involved in cell wall biosynthesis